MRAEAFDFLVRDIAPACLLDELSYARYHSGILGPVFELEKVSIDPFAERAYAGVKRDLESSLDVRSHLVGKPPLEHQSQSCEDKRREESDEDSAEARPSFSPSHRMPRHSGFDRELGNRVGTVVVDERLDLPSELGVVTACLVQERVPAVPRELDDFQEQVRGAAHGVV